RAVVASHLDHVNFGFLHLWHQALADHEVVDTPADVAVSRAGDLIAPAIHIAVLRIEGAEGTDKAVAHHIAETLTLLRGEPVGLRVFFWPGEVDLLMGDIEIAAVNHRFRGLGAILPGFEALHVGEEGGIPLHVTKRNTAQVALAVWRVDGG